MAVRSDARFLLIGVYFGFVLMRAEVVSWYRIQEMFRFHAFHMYGVIGTALLVAFLTVWAAQRCGLASADGRRLAVEPMPPGWRRYAAGGAELQAGRGARGRRTTPHDPTAPAPSYRARRPTPLLTRVAGSDTVPTTREPTCR